MKGGLGVTLLKVGPTCRNYNKSNYVRRNSYAPRTNVQFQILFNSCYCIRAMIFNQKS